MEPGVGLEAVAGWVEGAWGAGGVEGKAGAMAVVGAVEVMGAEEAVGVGGEGVEVMVEVRAAWEVVEVVEGGWG